MGKTSDGDTHTHTARPPVRVHIQTYIHTPTLHGHLCMCIHRHTHTAQLPVRVHTQTYIHDSLSNSVLFSFFF